MSIPSSPWLVYVLTLVLAFPAVAAAQCNTILDPNGGGGPQMTCNDMHVKMWFTFTADATATGTTFSSIGSSLFGSQEGLDPLTRALALIQGYDGRPFGLTLFNQYGGLNHGPDVPADGHSRLRIVSGSLVDFRIDNPNPVPVAIGVGITSEFTTTLVDPTGAGAGIDVSLEFQVYQQGAMEPLYTASGAFSQTSAGVQTTGLYNDAQIVLGNTRVGLDFNDPELMFIPANSRRRFAAGRLISAESNVVGPNASAIYNAGNTHAISLLSTAPGVTITAVPEPTTILLCLYASGLHYLRRSR